MNTNTHLEYNTWYVHVVISHQGYLGVHLQSMVHMEIDSTALWLMAPWENLWRTDDVIHQRVIYQHIT